MSLNPDIFLWTQTLHRQSGEWISIFGLTIPLSEQEPFSTQNLSPFSNRKTPQWILFTEWGHESIHLLSQNYFKHSVVHGGKYNYDDTKLSALSYFVVQRHLLMILEVENNVRMTHCITHRVVEAWAIMLPPIGFLGSAENMAAPSTCATTWFDITTATPNYCEIDQTEIVVRQLTAKFLG